MITYSMTYKEMYDDFAKDRERLVYRVNYYLPKAIKELSVTKTFPAWIIYDYVSPNTRNKYKLFYYAADRQSTSNPIKGIFSIVYLGNTQYIFKWLVSGYKHTDEREREGVRTIYVFTQHFLKRYNERVLKDNSLNNYDNLVRFLVRNPDYLPIEITKEINRNIEKYGEEGKRGFKVKDGICLTLSKVEGEANLDGDKNKDIVDAIVFLFTTFMPESQMTAEQQEAVLQEHWDKWNHYCEIFMNESKDGEITLRLNN